MNNQCYLLIRCDFKCDEAREAVISGCGDRLGVSHHGFLFMFPTAVKPVGRKKKNNNKSIPPVKNAIIRESRSHASVNETVPLIGLT